MRLLPGLNRIRATLVDADQLSTEAVVSVTYRPQIERRPTLHTLLVGAAHYDNSRFAQLRMVPNDLRTAARVFSAQAERRYGAVQVRALCDGPGCDGVPTRAGIQGGLAQTLAALQHGDHQLVYVSGHGVVLDGESYVVPRDGRWDEPESLIGWAELRTQVAAAAAPGKRLIMLDTCHAGAAKGHGDAHRQVQQAMERDGLYMLTATSAGTQAFEFAELGNGLFTHALVQGLEGAADLSPADGQVRFEELAHFLVREVAALARQRGVCQTSSAPFVPAELDYEVAQVPRTLRLSLSVRGHDGLDAAPAVVAQWRARLNAVAPDLRWIAVTRGVPALVVSLQPTQVVLQLKGRAGAELMRRALRPDAALPVGLFDRLRPFDPGCPPGAAKGGVVRRCPRAE